jgi:hypothetical protein
MSDNENANDAEVPTATDDEVASAARQLGLSTERAAPTGSKSGNRQVVQRLAHGRAHVVAVQIKHSRRQGA